MIEVDDKSGTLRMNTSNVGDQKEMITGGIIGLRPLTQYDIRVAAVNSAGIGPFTSTNASTLGITFYTFQSYDVNCWSFHPALHINDTRDDIIITDEREDERSSVGGVVAGVVVSLLVVAVVITAIILAGVWLWRRYVIYIYAYNTGTGVAGVDITFLCKKFVL